jgi:hypothetical protein
MYCFRHAHSRGREADREGAGEETERVEGGGVLEEFGDADADCGGDNFAQNGVAGLGEGGVDGVEFEDRGCTLAFILVFP